MENPLDLPPSGARPEPLMGPIAVRSGASDRLLKIGLVSPYDHASLGGVNDHINKLANEFRDWGHTVRVIAPCSKPQDITDEDFIPMGRPVPVPSGGSIARVSLSVWLRPRIKALLHGERFDIVHLHEPFAGFLTLNTLSISPSLDSVLIGTFHTFKGTRLYGFGGVKLAMPYFRRLSGRIAVSEPARQFISRYFPASYEIIPNGIHVDEFAEARPFEHLQDGMTNLLFVGRLEKRKGLKYLLGAYSRLKWDWPNLRLIVLGPGKPDADSYRLMAERNLQDVVFVGNASDAEKARYFSSADIFCAPATGKPVVATSIEGYSSVITDGVEGLLVEPKNEQALADSIATLLRDPALRARLAANGSRRAQEFRWERVAGRVMDYYRTFLDSKRAVASR